MFAFILAILAVIAGFVAYAMAGKKISYYQEAGKKADVELTKHTSISDYSGRRRLEDAISTCNSNINTLRKLRPLSILISVILALIFVIISITTVIPTGYTGIKTTFGKVDANTLDAGINFKLPWQNVINMDNREQRTRFALQSFSKDIQQVDIQGSINLNIDKTTAMNLYKDVGTGYADILVTPRVQEDVKIVIAKYSAENLVENRQRASDEIYDLLKKELSQKGINVISFAIENIDFTDAFESAVEAKQVATQEKQKAQTEQERQTMEMKQKAERDRIQAQAAADVQKIDADAKAYAVKVQADAEAEANKKIAETLSDPLIKYNMIHQWNGHLPVVAGGGSGLNLIDIQGIMETEEAK